MTRTSIRRAWQLLAVLVIAAAAAGVARPAGAATHVHFKSPSGTINCMVFSAQGGFADCVVRKASWASTPKRPRSCHLDWSANEVELGRTTVSLGQCRGDVGPRCYTGGDRCSVLAYGRSVTVGSIRCHSAASGITCRRTNGNHPGFFVSREGVVVYRS